MNTSSVLRNIQKQLNKGVAAKLKRKEPGSSEVTEHQAANQAQTSQVDNSTVEKGLQALQTEIKSAPKPVQHKHEYKQPDLDDLNPFPTNADSKKANAQNQQSSTKEEDIEALFKGKLSQKEVQEKIKALKDSPELIQAYVLKLERKRCEEEQQLQIKALNEKILHRKQMYNMVQLPMPVMTGEYLQEHKRDIRSDKFHKEVIYKDIIIKGQELINKIVHVNHQKHLIDKRKRQSYKPKYHTDIPILPITFIKQRNQLLSMCYIASRMSLLYFTSSKYSQINAFNVDLINKVNNINKNLKCRFFRSKFLQQREASGKLQSQLKLLIVMKRHQLRINALKQIRSFLYRNYNQNTFLGPVKRLNDDIAVIKTYLEESQVNFEARLPFIQIKLEQADKKAAFIMAQQALFDADVKAQKASKKPFVEKDINTFQPTEDDIKVYLMESDDITIIAKALLKSLLKTYSHELVEVYDNNMNYSPMTPSAFSLIPTDSLCLDIINKYKISGIQSEADIDLGDFEIEREVIEEPEE